MKEREGGREGVCAVPFSLFLRGVLELQLMTDLPHLPHTTQDMGINTQPIQLLPSVLLRDDISSSYNPTHTHTHTHSEYNKT